MIYQECPQDFDTGKSVVSCFIECGEEFLMLHRQDHERQGNTWGAPAGGQEKGEDEITAILREVQEETGIFLKAQDIQYVRTLYIKYPEFDFVYHIFQTQFIDKPPVLLNAEEHKDYKWVTPSEALQLPLIGAMDEVISLQYKLAQSA